MMQRRSPPVSRLLSLVLVTALSSEVGGVPTSLKIGGLFPTKLDERVFRYAVDYVNKGDVIGHGITLDHSAYVTGNITTFESIQFGCQFAEQGVMAIVGPMSSTTVKAVAPVSTALHIPVIAPTATNPHLGDKAQHPFLVGLSPSDDVQSLALVDLVAYYGWTRMSILTSDTDYGINGLVAFQSEAAKAGWSITSVQQFSSKAVSSDVDAISQLKLIKETRVRVVILNCLAVMAKEVLRQAEDLDMTGPGWAWVVTDGTTSSRDVSVEGLMGTSPASSRGQLYDEFAHGWNEMNAQEGFIWGDLSVSQALIADAVLAVAFGVRSMYDDPSNEHVDFSDSVQCGETTDEHLKYGRLLLQHISNIREDGVASSIEFNADAAPMRPLFDIVNLKQHGWLKVGEWDTANRLLMSHPNEVTFMGGRTTVHDSVSNLANRTLTVVTVEEEPFVWFPNGYVNRLDVQPHEVQGYLVDMLNELAEMSGFTYTLYVVEDGAYGIKDPVTGEWNGAVRDLVDRKADVALASLTISKSRETDVDFTTPYVDTGLGLLMKKPKMLPIRPFSFMDPFTTELWMYIGVTVFAVGVTVSVFNKLSPYDYHGEFMYSASSNLEKEAEMNPTLWKKNHRKKMRAIAAMNMGNSIWSAVASLLQQGSDHDPKSLSGRIVTVLWCFGILIFVKNYTANLTAFLTSSRLQTTINSVEELAAQTKIPYGTIGNSAIEQFFRDSVVTVFKDMNSFMESRGTFLLTNDDGVEKVRTGTFAYIADSFVVEYTAELEPCELRKVGRIFAKIGYGLALQKSSPYRVELSYHILQLRKNGFMEQIKHKWYVERGQCSRGKEESSEAAKEIEEAGGRLDYTHLLGVFYIIYGSLALSLVVVVVEWIVMCVKSVDREDPLMPQSLTESVRKHVTLLGKDFLEDWLPRLPAVGPLQHVGWGKASTLDTGQNPSPDLAHEGTSEDEDPFASISNIP